MDRNVSLSGFRNRTHSRPFAGVLVTVAALNAGALAADRSWKDTAWDYWSTAANWSPNGVPLSTDVVRVGNLAGVKNTGIWLDQTDTIAELHVTDGMAIQFEGYSLYVTGDTTLSGRNSVDGIVHSSRLYIEDTVPAAFKTENLTLDDGAQVKLVGEAVMHVYDTFMINTSDDYSSLMWGEGSVLLYGNGTTFRNDGIVSAGSGTGLRFHQKADGLFDLDGLSGDGKLDVNSSGGPFLHFGGAGLSDPFSGFLRVTATGELNMNLEDGWIADSNSTIQIGGFGDGYGPAVIRGTTLTFRGTLDTVGANAHLLMKAPVIIESPAIIDIGGDDRLDFGVDGAETIIEGGEFTLGDGGQLTFNGPTTIHGGTFNTVEYEEATGDVDFDGPTEWAGEVTINGRAQQTGDAKVMASTVITAERFDIDGGAGGPAEWDIRAPLVINTAHTGTSNLDFVDSVININSGLLSKLTINLSGGSQYGWALDGTMNLSGSKYFFMDRLGGTAYLVHSGQLNISDTKVEISAGVYFMPWGTVTFEAPASQLRMRGYTAIREGATFEGQGTLVNGVGGEMDLIDTASLDEVGLENFGELSIYPYETHAGQASVDRFTNDDKGTLRVRIGGYELGEEYDHVLVTGGDVALDGTLEIELADFGAGMFVPEVGDEFTIITAAGDVTGAFVSNPSNCGDGNEYQWTVLYGAHDVRVRLDGVSGHAGDMNCDCLVNFEDIDPFVIAMTSEAEYNAQYPDCIYMNGDANGDGSVNFNDIDPFVLLLIE